MVKTLCLNSCHLLWFLCLLRCKPSETQFRATPLLFSSLPTSMPMADLTTQSVIAACSATTSTTLLFLNYWTFYALMISVLCRYRQYVHSRYTTSTQDEVSSSHRRLPWMWKLFVWNYKQTVKNIFIFWTDTSSALKASQLASNCLPPTRTSAHLHSCSVPLFWWQRAEALFTLSVPSLCALNDFLSTAKAVPLKL